MKIENYIHKPVLLNEILEMLDPHPGQSYIDATANGGGHTFAIWEKIKPNGKILAIDKDCDLVESLKSDVNPPAGGQLSNVIPICGNYADLKEIAARSKFKKISGILFDLGYSSYHLEQSGRGFSFQKDEPLIMRYETDSHLGTGLTAAEVVNQFSESELADIFFKYGEERHSRKIAKKIVEERRKKRILTTFDLVEVIKKAAPYQAKRLHPATKVFQALRIFVNAELEGLESALPQAVDILAPAGKIAVISFHSLEDRIVKNFFKDKKSEGSLKIITKKPIRPSAGEISDNPRARSAKLRVAEKTVQS